MFSVLDVMLLEDAFVTDITAAVTEVVVPLGINQE